MIVKNWVAGLAATLIAPAASALDSSGQIYGALRLSLGFYDAQTGGDTDVDNNNSHLGIRAQTVEGPFTAFAEYERLADNDDGTPEGELTRKFYGGVTHVDWGTLVFGRAPTAYKLAGQKLDPFYNTGVSGPNGSNASIANGAGYGLSSLTGDQPGNGFINNQLAYTSPAIANLTVNAAVFLDDAGGDGEELDFGGGIEWQADGITLGVQALDISTGSNPGSEQNFFFIGLSGASSALQAVRAYGAYAAQGWGVGASHEMLDLKGGLPNRAYTFVSGWYGLSDRLRLAASAGQTEDTPFEGISFTLGGSYEVLEYLNAYAAARLTDRDATEINTAQADDVQAYVVGVSYTFEIGFGGS